MSGICGIWNLDGAPVDGSLLATLSGVLQHRGIDGEARWIEGEIGFAFQNLWITPEAVGTLQPVIRPGESVVMFDGRLDNRDDLFNSLEAGHSIAGDSSDALLVSALYRKYGDRLPGQLNGDFAMAIYDVRERRLLLARDALGVRPLYFARTPHTFIVASEVKPILAHPSIACRPNADMLAVALLGSMGQDREGWTFFEGVSSVLPGQMVTVTRDAIAKRTYWDFASAPAIRFATFDRYKEAFRDVFERAVARRLRSHFPVAVSISGGVDSSSVYCMAETLRRRSAARCPKVIGMSMEVDARLSDERAYLDAIEQKYGTTIQRVPSAVRYATGSLTKAFRDTETPYFRGPVDPAYPFQRAVRDKGARVQLSGLFGDQVLVDTGYLIDFARGLKWVDLWEHLAEQTKWNGGGSTYENAKDCVRDLVRYHVPDSLWRFARRQRRRLVSYRGWYTEDFLRHASRAEASQQFNPRLKTAHQRSLYQFVRPMYYVQGLEIANKIAAVNGLEFAYPFFDRDLVSFLFAIPGGIAYRGGVPKAILRSAMQDVLPAVIAERRWKAQNTEELNAAMDREFADLAGYLDRGALSVASGYVDEAQLRKRLPMLRHAILDGTGAVTQQFGDLFGLEIWLRSFFDNQMDWEHAKKC
jgi:asparagine synthase (glutamine-hydrolysing)